MTRVPQPDTERHNRTQPAEPAAIPTVVGYHGGQQVLFIHTEMSDPQMAEQLTHRPPAARLTQGSWR